MKIRQIPLLLIFLLTSGCAGITVVPRSDAPGQINATDRSITQTNQKVSVTARVRDLELRPYQLEQNICSFKVQVQNNRDQQISFPAERFMLYDTTNTQYRPVSPGKIRKIVADLDPYLIPYPYVGYYYEGDAERARNQNAFNSEITYFPTKTPRSIALEALPESPIESGKQISGVIYFLADLRTMKGFTLTGSALLTNGVKSSDFIFPFSVVKK